ncbi:hypothetical protein OIU84_009026 [Salix udensis]|uniref:Secreted protein n=1 Tax=Salix udensis TaxID=889485 RepID=A0AAD6JSF7_9ROSI|nr:hypothetical protein OIU84_009026 [Salix udensis]
MAYRIGTVCIIALLLSSFTLTCSARPEPALADVTPVEISTLHGDNAEAETAEVEKSCEGVGRRRVFDEKNTYSSD